MRRKSHGLALNALGDPTRRTILEMLVSGRSSVGRIASRLPVSRPAVSKHLKVLRRAGLVTVEADGTRMIYGADPKGIATLRKYFDALWEAALPRPQRAAETMRERA